MAEGGAAQCQDRRANLSIGDDLNSEDIGKTWSAIVSEGAEDEVLALLVEDEDAGEHDGGAILRKWRLSLVSEPEPPVYCSDTNQRGPRSCCLPVISFVTNDVQVSAWG